ncbi:MAG TPA: hemerythrin domain-containing protein [Caldimonas sp.]|nr:hemerythrin domain-containing protein [Caldimonas sp.]
MPAKPRSDRARDRRVATDATELLSADHREVRGLFVEYRKLARERAPGSDRRPLAEEICTLLTVHAAIEEEIFYPEARAAGIDADLLDQAEVEHAAAKDLIASIRDMDAGDPLYDAKVNVLGEYVDHHVAEEEGELFAKCRTSAMDLRAVGARLATRHSELVNEMSEGMEVVD